jgi:hypothetical protein
MTAATGRYQILDHSAIKERAERDNDPRHIFYEALLACDTYESYRRRVGHVTVQPATTSYAVTGNMELDYVRNRRRWVADA